MNSPLVAKAAQAGQFVRVLAGPKGELIPLTLADWDAEAGTIDLVIQGMGTVRIADEQDGGRRGLHRHCRPARPAQQAAPLRGRPDRGVLRGRPRPAAGLSDHAGASELGNHVTLIAGYRTADLLFWTGEDERVGKLQEEFRDRLEVIYTTNDGTFGVKGFVTAPLEELLDSRTRRARAARSPR